MGLQSPSKDLHMLWLDDWISWKFFDEHLVEELDREDSDKRHIFPFTQKFPFLLVALIQKLGHLLGMEIS